MARKLPGLQRVFDAPSLALVAYGEVGSSIYFALGIVALYALGLTPWVLLLVGAIVLLVALSYAEGAAALPEPGGASAFVRRAFNDPAGFTVGWLLLLDYVAVIALAALFVPHYFGTAVGLDGITRSPADVVAAIFVVVLLVLFRLVRRVRLIPVAIVLTLVAFVSQVVVVVLGLVYLLSTRSLGKGVDLGTAPSWHDAVFALALSALAYTGLETVANLAAETRSPERALPRGVFAGLGAVVIVSVALAVVGISAYPAAPDPSAPGGLASALGTDWLRRPLLGITAALDAELPAWAADVLRVFVGLSGALVLVGAIVTSIAGAARLSHSLARHSMLPHAFARPGRTTAVATVATVAPATVACLLLVVADAAGNEVTIVASLYSFGIFLAFTGAQLAVIRLRRREPHLPRPFRVPGSILVGGHALPLPAAVGAALTFALWIASLATHDAARIAGPVWLVLGALVYVRSRRAGREALLARVEPPVGDIVPDRPEGAHERILVPVKMGEIGEEVLATGLKLAAERTASIRVLTVIRVPLDRSLDAPDGELEAAAAASLEEAKEVAAEHRVEIEGQVVRARSIGEAIVAEAEREGADLIVLGSHPRWRRWSRFFSPTVDHVLRHAPCEVMVVAYPEGVLSDEPDE